MNTMINKYATKDHYTPRITVEQYNTRKVKGNGNIRSFLAVALICAVLCTFCYVIGG